MSASDKQLVEEELRMHLSYDWFLDDNPDVQEREQRGELRGEQRGELRGGLRVWRTSIMKIIKNRFPSLVEVAQQRIIQIENQDQLDQLLDQFLIVPNEIEARKLLQLP